MRGADRRFAFGENWLAFSSVVDAERVRTAASELAAKLNVDSLAGMSFLDVGCGSGLSSAAAATLGASPVRSFDYDRASVEATERLRRAYGAGTDWTVEQGDATDESYMDSLGRFDIVYAWGVLHHTGAMWRALDNTARRVAPNGTLFIALYNDQGPTSARWRQVKRTYNSLPDRLRTPYAVVAMAPTEARMIVSASIRGKLGSYLRSWTESRERGMSRWHDLLDWVGGYPFEVAKPEEVFRFCRDRGFELRELTTCGGGIGCNEYVFRRPPVVAPAAV